MTRHRHPANQRRYDQRTFGERLADQVTAKFGSWGFITVQTAFVAAWIAANLLAWANEWDPYPFILLNLVFSTQAAYAAPLLLLSQNRQAERDRIKAEHDFATNQLALQFLIAWHRDAHPAGCVCVLGLRSVADEMLADVAAGLADSPHDQARSDASAGPSAAR